MVIAALAALAAFLVALLARAEVVPETPGALVALAIAVVVIAASARAWLGGGHWADRDRLPIATPIALAGGAVAAALGVLVSPGVGVLVSVLVALGSAAFLGIALSGRRRPRGGPPA